MSHTPIKIEIWSDIVCPFCYIGKRNLEAALADFSGSEDVTIVWHSFQLDPDMPVDTDEKPNLFQYLAERKGIPLESSIRMHDNLIATAARAGLTYHFDRAIIANSFRAHRLMALATNAGVSDPVSEALFRTYFTLGQDIGHIPTLVAIGTMPD